MEQKLITVNGEYQDLTGEYTQKRFDSVGEFLRKSAMSPIVGGFIAMMGCLAGYVILKNFTSSTAQPEAMIVMGGIFGMLAIVLINYITKGRVQ